MKRCYGSVATPNAGWPREPVGLAQNRADYARLLIAAIGRGTPIKEIVSRLHALERHLLSLLRQDAEAQDISDELKALHVIAASAKELSAALRTVRSGALPVRLAAGQGRVCAVRFQKSLEASGKVKVQAVGANLAPAGDIAYWLSLPGWPGQDPLILLAEAAETEHRYMRQHNGSGRGNVHQRLHGDPRAQLCEAACSLLLGLGMSEAQIKASKAEHLYRLMLYLWQAATGTDGRAAISRHYVRPADALAKRQAVRRAPQTPSPQASRTKKKSIRGAVL